MSTVIDDVKSRANLVEIIGRTVELKKVGSTYKGLCPFHAEKTPSFHVSDRYQNWTCWGCSKHGDVFDFIGERDHLEFSEVLRLLAHEVGVTLPERGRESDREKKQLLYEIMDKAAVFYQKLLRGKLGFTARLYLAERGLTEETQKLFGIGYAARWNELSNYLHDEGYSPEDIYDAGLTVKVQGGREIDFLRERIVFPIKDKHGRTIALGGRSLRPNAVNTPKYMNTCDTLIFHKQDVLYGLDQPATQLAIASSKLAVVVEGYFDVITAYQNNLPYSVATMGTAVTTKHLKQLKGLTDEIVLAMDSDRAGQAATWRVLQTADESLREGVAPVLGPNRRHQSYKPGRAAHLRVMQLPGKDPDDVIRADPKAWQGLIESALPVMDFVLSQIKTRYDLNSGAEKADAAAEVAEVLSSITNPVERAHYVQQAADLLEVDQIDIRELIVDQDIRLDTTEKPSETDGDVEWDAHTLALFRLSLGTPYKLYDLPLLSSLGRAFVRDRIQNPGAFCPDELADFQQSILDRYDSLSLRSSQSIRTLFSDALATLKRRAALRERASLLSALRDAESDTERTQLVGALNQWAI